MQVYHIVLKFLDCGIELFDISNELRSGSVQLVSLALQKAVKSIFFESKCPNLTFVVSFCGFEFFFFGLVLNVTVFKFFLIPDDEVLIFMDLSFEFSLTVDNFIFFVISHLVSFDCEIFHLSGSVVNNFLKFIDFSIEEIKLILVGILEKSEFRVSHAVKLLFKIFNLQIVDMLLLDHLIFQIFIFVFEQSVRIFVIVLDLLIFGKNAFNFEIFRVDNFLQFGVFVIKSLNLVQVLFLEIFNF